MMMMVIKDDPNDDDLDRILSETEILPSSGFAASVMAAVRREAEAPPPIPFPWKRFVPGFVVAGGVLGWGAVETVRFAGLALVELRHTQAQVTVNAALARPLEQAAWVVAALAVPLITWMISRRFAG